MIRQGGVKLDGQVITDENLQVKPVEGMVIQVGKRRFAKILVG